MMRKSEIKEELEEARGKMHNLPPVGPTVSAMKHLEDFAYLTGYCAALKKVLEKRLGRRNT